MDTSTELARFACDYCRQKKFRCSRELPKCGACKPWPGPCVYSRDKPPTHAQVNLEPKTAAANPAGSVEKRLENIERAIERLTGSVDQILKTVTNRPTENAASPAAVSTLPISEKTEQSPGLFVGSSHSFSFLKETPANIDAVAKTSTPLAHQKAYSELQFLSNSLTTATINPHPAVPAGEVTGFYVPSKPAGYKLIGQFLEQVHLGEPFFRSPSDDLLRQIVFEPASVTQKAWVVYVNYMMLAMVSANEDAETEEARRFRHNTRLALNDSRIFLEPTEANVQALTLLSIHGEDYASPNLSWMLVGHACRQAEALGLHASTEPDYEVRQRYLCMFWLLFVADKSCSLAFGRSAFLPMSQYRLVPIPDFNFLIRFQGHGASHASVFGAHLLTKMMELSRLMGCVLDLLTPGQPSVPRADLGAQFRLWYQQTNKVLSETMDAERPSSTEAQLREMSLGISSMKFQYLHIVILLYKGDASSAGLLLEHAREALSLLPNMVSNWASTYNGVVWHLLYYPFIPFFVVFENIVHGHTFQLSSTIKQDLDLLSTAVSYFVSMRGQLRLLSTVCARLEHVAAVFLQLAQVHVNQQSSSNRDNRTRTTGATSDRPSAQLLSYQEHEDVAATLSKAQEDLGAGPDLDMGSFLDWLPSDMFAPLDVGVQEQNTDLGALSEFFAASTADAAPRGKKRTFDATFDWFSWDAYYATADSRRNNFS